jgi:Ca2+-binding RTX toxin-like protein
MSVSLNPATGILTATGTPNDDRIAMSVNAGVFRVVDNGATRTFPAAAVKGVVARGGAGADSITLDPSVKVNATLYANGTATRKRDFNSDGDSLTGGSGNDRLVASGDYRAENFAGGAGNDVFDLTGAYEAWAEGGAGNDRFLNPQVETAAIGGPGTDTADFSSLTRDLVIGAWEDIEAAGYFGRFSGSDPFLSEIENYVGGSGNDVIIGTAGNNTLDGNGGHDTILGGGGNDLVKGRAGNDRLYGQAGDDVLFGGTGNDLVDGGSGRDALHGEDGNDTLFSRDSVADFLSGGFGTDKARKDSADQLVGVDGLLA